MTETADRPAQPDPPQAPFRPGERRGAGVISPALVHRDLGCPAEWIGKPGQPGRTGSDCCSAPVLAGSENRRRARQLQWPRFEWIEIRPLGPAPRQFRRGASFWHPRHRHPVLLLRLHRGRPVRCSDFRLRLPLHAVQAGEAGRGRDTGYQRRLAYPGGR